MKIAVDLNSEGWYHFGILKKCKAFKNYLRNQAGKRDHRERGGVHADIQESDGQKEEKQGEQMPWNVFFVDKQINIDIFCVRKGEARCTTPFSFRVLRK